MKKLLLSTLALSLCSFLAQSQCCKGKSACKKFEIGLGVGPSQIVHNGEANLNFKERKTNFSRVNSILANDTKKKSSMNSPSLYLGYSISRNLKFRTSFNFYKETRELLPPIETLAPLTTWNSNYSGTFEQYRMAMGVAYTLQSSCCMKSYIALDLVNYAEKANESYIKTSSEGGAITNQKTMNTSTTYSVGLNPSFGIKKMICHSFSINYEAGAEIKYNAGQFKTVNIICMPLNRLSINYRF